MSRMPDPHDVFFQYPVTPFATSAGNVDLPIFYYDNSLCMAVFLVDLDKARALVTDERLQVVPAWGGKALVGLAFYEYRHTAIGAYNEVGLAVLTAPRGCRLPRLPLLRMLGSLDRNPMGFHILDLPVTTEVACAAGREAWGLPKFVTPIDFALRGREFRGSVRDPEGDHPIVTLEGKGGLGVPGPLLDLSLYSVRDGKLLRTLVNTRGGATCMLGGGMRVTIDPQSGHPMAQRLRQLGLQNARSFFVSAGHRLQLRLNAGAVVADA